MSLRPRFQERRDVNGLNQNAFWLVDRPRQVFLARHSLYGRSIGAKCLNASVPVEAVSIEVILECFTADGARDGMTERFACENNRIPAGIVAGRRIAEGEIDPRELVTGKARDLECDITTVRLQLCHAFQQQFSPRSTASSRLLPGLLELAWPLLCKCFE